LYTKKGISEHVKRHCAQSTNLDEEYKTDSIIRSRLAASSVLERGRVNVPSLNPLLDELKRDDISDIIKSDHLILYTAQLYLMRKADGETNQSIRQRLRLLARLVKYSECDRLADLLLPSQMIKVCGIINSKFEPTVRMRLGQMLRTSMDLMRNLSIKEKRQDIRDTMNDAIHIHDSEYKHRVGYAALLESERKRFSTRYNIIPLSQDVAKMSQFLDGEITKCVNAYATKTGNPNRSKKVLIILITILIPVYDIHFPQILACKVILFNKRRGAEFIKCMKMDIVEAVKLERENICDVQEIKNQLTPIEIHLSSQMRLIRIRGKQGRGVPVLLRRVGDMELLELLLDDPRCRDDVYMFQTRFRYPYRSDGVIRTLTQEVKLEKPDLIRATALRKYCATALQVKPVQLYHMSRLNPS
jgi:hypothetical protein